MADCPKFKIDSNDTGLRFAVEECLKQLPTTPIWRPLEPNSYGDFGGTTTTVGRAPINASRQRQKGVISDKDASASFVTDMTSNNHQQFMQGFVFAAAKEQATTNPLNGVPIQVGATTATELDFGTATGFVVGDVVLCSGYTNPANNGVKTLGVVTGTKALVASGTVALEAAPPATAVIQRIGKSHVAGVVKIAVAGGVNTLTVAAGHGLVAGDWFFLGGADADSYFPANRGFARAVSVSGGSIVFDKPSWGVVTAEVGTGKSVVLMVPTIIKNQPDPANILRYSYQFERTLGRDAVGTMSQYVSGSVANELTVTVNSADKVTMEMAFVSCDAETRSGTQGVKSGTRPPLVFSDAINTSSDVRRLAFFLTEDTSAPLFAYATEMTITVNNNASGAKAIGTLGNFDVNVGTFEVGGSVTAYFQDVRAIQAVENNADVTMDLITVKNNEGIVFDIPLLTLGGGMLNVEADNPVTVPLDNLAAESEFGHTMLYAHFAALPDWA